MGGKRGAKGGPLRQQSKGLFILPSTVLPKEEKRKQLPNQSYWDLKPRLGDRHPKRIKETRPGMGRSRGYPGRGGLQHQGEEDPGAERELTLLTTRSRPRASLFPRPLPMKVEPL